MPDSGADTAMLILQDHQRRITTLENNMEKIIPTMESVEKAIKESNDEQIEMLNSMNKRMYDEFFKKKRVNLDNGWKFVLNLIGGGSVLYVLVDIIRQLIG